MNSYKLSLADTARLDLKKIAAWYANKSFGLDIQFRKHIQDIVRKN